MKAFLTVLILVYAASSACTGDHKINGLVTGTLNLNSPIGNPDSQVFVPYNYTFANPFAEQPKAALGLMDAQLKIQSPNQNGETSIRILAVDNARIRLLFAHANGGWRSAKISLMASTNPQIILGTASIDFGSLANSRVIKTINTPAFSSPANWVSRVFLNGAALNNGTSFQIQLDFQQVTTSGNINVAFLTGPLTDLKTAFISYFILNPGALGAVAYSDRIAEYSFAGSNRKDVFKMAVAPSYYLVGLTRLNLPSVFSLTSSLSEDFVFNYELSQAKGDFSFVYIILDALAKNVCTNCPQVYSYGTQCVNECPADAYLAKYSDGSSGCVRCSASLSKVVNSNRNGCACRAGFDNVDGECLRNLSNLQTLTPTVTPISAPSTPTQNPNIVPAHATANQSSSTNTGASTTQNQNIIPAHATTNSYNPQAPTQTQTTTSTIDSTNSYVPTPAQPNKNTQVQPELSKIGTEEDCTKYPNTYWTNYRCACKPGYKLDQSTGVCIKIGLVIIETPSQTSCGDNSYFINGLCVCREGYYKNAYGNCVAKVVCPENSYNVDNSCICNAGYKKSGEKCIRECSSHSTLVGGDCLCDKDYQKQGQECVPIKNKCPPNSYEQVPGKCICSQGFIQTSVNPLVCSHCEIGGYFDNSKCIYPCGQYEKYNSQTKKCECEKGYGYSGAVCSICSGEFFLKDMYCVACPLGSSYNSAKDICECNSGYQMTNGRCSSQCYGDQVYDQAAKKCVCKQGLGIVNGACSLCPSGTFPDPATQACTGCGANQVQVGNKCQCKPGFGFGNNGQCEQCSNIIEGYCATCPIGKIWGSSLTKCSCPEGQKEVDGKCEQICKSNELVDEFGNCYTCLIGEIIKNGQCICADEQPRDPIYGCQKQCGGDSHKVGSYCVICPLNTIFDAKLQACVCKPGWFKNINQICEPSIVPPIACDAGKFYNPQEGCLPCARDCKTCKDSANYCLSCSNPLLVAHYGQCVSPCGNGFVEGTEQCDDKNTQDGDGCSKTCQIENGYTCKNSPSVCTLIPNNNCGDGKLQSGEGCDDKNQKNLDGCSSTCQVEADFTCSGQPSVCKGKPKGMQLVGSPIINSGAVYSQIRTEKRFIFDSREEMTSFMKYKFQQGTEPSSAYCNQIPTDPNIFNCYFIYPSGVPLFEYSIGLSFDHKGETGRMDLFVDYKKSAFATRSLG